jgi:hypothetical protein
LPADSGYADEPVTLMAPQELGGAAKWPVGHEQIQDKT